MNIKHIKRDAEADLVCSKLSELNMVDFVISEDMDHLTSGTKILLRDFSNRSNSVTVYKSDNICKTLELSHDHWIYLCILFGCDYINRIRGMGYKSSYKIICDNKEKSLDEIINLIKSKKKYIVDDNYKDKFSRAVEIFKNNQSYNLENIITDPKNDVFDNQIKIISDYLHKYTQFSDLKIKNRIKNIYGYCI